MHTLISRTGLVFLRLKAVGGGVLPNVRSPSHTFQMAVCDLILILSLTTHIASASLSSPGPIPGWMVVLYHISGEKIKREFSIHEKKFQSPFLSPFPFSTQNCRAPPQNLPRNCQIFAEHPFLCPAFCRGALRRPAKGTGAPPPKLWVS